MQIKTVLFVSHPGRQCGIHQFGRSVARALGHSEKFRFHYLECSGTKDLFDGIRSTAPAAILYNYHPLTMPWLDADVTRRVLKKLRQAAILHDVTQELANEAGNELFDYHIAADPTLVLNNPRVFKTGRLVPRYVNSTPSPETPTIGCLGFGVKGRGFEKVVAQVQREYDRAIIRLHLPFIAFPDSDETEALALVARCRELIRKPGIELRATHDFLSPAQLLDFLAANTVNAFFYEEMEGRGISGAIDQALAVRRPIAVTRAGMFRHIMDARPSICIEDSTLKQIVARGIEPLRPFYEDWTEANLIWDYDRIVTCIREWPLPAWKPPEKPGFFGRMARKLKGAFARSTPEETGEDAEHLEVHPPNPVKVTYSHRTVPRHGPLNRILDDTARERYQAATEALYELAPELMERQIPRADIQQAFVLDTVLKLAEDRLKPKILCIGGFEEGAAASLKEMGLRFEIIHPSLNYDLGTFVTKPSTLAAGYNIVFATSIIEHVEDDELFLRQIAWLLAPGGAAVLTCDFNDAYQPGAPKPPENYRLYTQKDFRKRLMAAIPDCSLVDLPQWDCPNPDFTYAGCVYTFATLVFQKR